jgi:hypothetical protein
VIKLMMWLEYGGLYHCSPEVGKGDYREVVGGLAVFEHLDLYAEPDVWARNGGRGNKLFFVTELKVNHGGSIGAHAGWPENEPWPSATHVAQALVHMYQHYCPCFTISEHYWKLLVEPQGGKRDCIFTAPYGSDGREWQQARAHGAMTGDSLLQLITLLFISCCRFANIPDDWGKAPEDPGSGSRPGSAIRKTPETPTAAATTEVKRTRPATEGAEGVGASEAENDPTDPIISYTDEHGNEVPRRIRVSATDQLDSWEPALAELSAQEKKQAKAEVSAAEAAEAARAKKAAEAAEKAKLAEGAGSKPLCEGGQSQATLHEPEGEASAAGPSSRAGTPSGSEEQQQQHEERSEGSQGSGYPE